VISDAGTSLSMRFSLTEAHERLALGGQQLAPKALVVRRARLHAVAVVAVEAGGETVRLDRVYAEMNWCWRQPR